MAQSYLPYVVRLGDHLEQIAQRFGVSANDLRDFPKNKDLGAKRGDMSMLVAGDLLFIPSSKREKGLPIEVGQVNSYVARIPKVDVNMRLVDKEGPIAGETYTVEGLDTPVKGTTDGDGNLSFAAPVTTRAARIVLANRPAIDVAIGGLDPVDEISGAQMRLANLGLYGGAAHGEVTEHFRGSLLAFQKLHDLEMTGELDAVTRDKLVAKHGA